MTTLERGADTLEALYEEHGQALRRLCTRRLGPGPDVDDAVQETLVRAWRGLDRFDGNRPMWPWLATIAGNVCIDLQRHRRMAAERGRVTIDLDHDVIEDRALRHETGAVVREALGRMTSSAAAMLYLRDVEGWDYDRIGAHLDRNPGAARTAVTRARHQLRAHVEEIARSRGHWPLAGVMGLVWGGIRRRAVRIGSAASDTTTAATQRINALGELLPASWTATQAVGVAAGALTAVGALVVPVIATSPDPAPAVLQPAPAEATASPGDAVFVAAAEPTGTTEGEVLTPTPLAAPAAPSAPTVDAPSAPDADDPTELVPPDEPAVAPRLEPVSLTTSLPLALP